MPSRGTYRRTLKVFTDRVRLVIKAIKLNKVSNLSTITVLDFDGLSSIGFRSGSRPIRMCQCSDAFDWAYEQYNFSGRSWCYSCLNL